MTKRLPNILSKHKICIICEGNEEYSYLKRLNDLKVWQEQYDFTFINAKGNGNIPARYQDMYQNASYELVLIFCDTEKKPHEQYLDIKRKINEFHGVIQASNQVIIFGNPCTLQIILKHWTNVTIKTAAKAVNAPLIYTYTGVINYKGRQDQIDKIMMCVDENNYVTMTQYVKELSRNDLEIGSTNFSDFLDHFEDKSINWMDDINAVLEA